MRTTPFRAAETPRHLPLFSFWFGTAFSFAVLLLLVSDANAQWTPWKIATPRDTIFVPAYYGSGVPPWKATHSAASSCVQTKFYFSGTFGIFPGEDSAGLDARYMYYDPSWSAPLPLPNPATWEATLYNVYLQICNNQNPIDADSVHVLETSFQANHVYSAIYPSEGVPFQFRIYNRISAKPDGSYYRQATGGITVRTAQFTAGVAVEYNSITFPTTNVGTITTQLDSIAAYGLDLLQVDSVWISGPNAADFTVSSQRGLRFTLDSVSGNAFTVSYQPDQPNVQSQAYLNIKCPNADCGHRLVSIALSGYSVAPNGTIGPLAIDFGTVPINSYYKAFTNISDSGSATYQIVSLTMGGPDAAAFVSNTVPFSVPPGTTVPFDFSFRPIAPRVYHATALLTDNENHSISITLTGTGAAAHVIARDTALNFGTLFTGDDTTVLDTITNMGTATARVVLDTLQCNDPYWFSYDPPATNFYLNAGDSRIYRITFHPNKKTNTTLTACLTFYFDDGSIPLTIDLNGAEKIRQVKYDSNHVDFGTVEISSTSQYNLGFQNLASTSVGIHSNLPTAPSMFGEFFNPTADSIFDSGSHFWNFRFRPFLHGPIGEWVYMTCSTGQLDSIYLSGVGAEPQPDFTPPLVDFGVCNDGTSNYGSTTLTDTGDYPLSVCSYSIIGPDASEFTIINPISTPYAVADSGKSSLAFRFNFTTNVHAGRLHTASLVVNFCDGSSDTIPLQAQEARLSVQFCWNEVDFGTIRINSSRDTGVCLRSKESIPQSVDSIWITSGGVPFVSAAHSAIVPPFDTFYDSVQFAPTARGPFHAMLHGVGSGMVEDSILLTGIGAEPAPALSTKTLDLGAITLLNTTGAEQVMLSDTGNWPFAVRIVKSGDRDQEFNVAFVSSSQTVDTVATDSVHVNAPNFYAVTFTPKFPRLPDHRASLLFYYDNGTVDTVTLIGRDHSGFLAFDRDTLDFGKVRIGTSPPALAVEIFNTSDTTLVAKKITGPSAPFSANYMTPVAVDSDNAVSFNVTFAPTAIGVVSNAIAGIGSPFNAAARDTVIVTGIGAAPAPKLSVDTLFFDTVAWGRSITRNFTLSDTGNWTLTATTGAVAGMNSGDFTPSIDPTISIVSDSTATYSVTFLASTALTATPRVGTMTWTEDDGTQFTLVLVANDVPPYHVQIGFPSAYWGRPGDKIAVELDLQNAVPDTLGIRTLSGIVTWDPNIVVGPDVVVNGGVQPGTLIPTSNWVPSVTYHPGWFQYSITGKSDTDVLSKPGQLLTFLLQFQGNLKDGASSPLIDSPSLPDIIEAYAPVESTTIFLDSVCGTVHLLSGDLPIANYIEQNIPNPFGGTSPTTTLTFNVAADNTIVTIRLLDPTGREMLRPVDRQPFTRGTFQTTIDATSLPAGIYFYEFQANGEPPQMRKMSVE